MEQEDTIMTVEEASAFTRLSIKNLQARRCYNQPPAYIKLGRLVRYRRSDLERFLADSVVDTKHQGSV